METVISLEQVSSVDVRRFDEVYAVKAGDHSQWQVIAEGKRLAPMYHPDTPAQVAVVSSLLIEVEILDDQELLEQLRAKCNVANRAT